MPRTGGDVRQDTHKCEYGGHRTMIHCSGLMRRSGGAVQRCNVDDQDQHLGFTLGAARACPEGAAAGSEQQVLTSLHLVLCVTY